MVFRINLLVLYVIIPVALLSAAIIYFRAEEIIEPEKISEVGLEEARQEDAKGFAMLAIMFGIVVSIVYTLLSRWNADAVSLIFNVLGVSLFTILSILAVILRSRAGLGGIIEVIFLNVIWATGFGFLLPMILE